MSEKSATQRAFDKLSNQQKRNAIKFGSLSDFHIATLRGILDRKISSSNGLMLRVYYDIYKCSEYTGCEPHGGGSPTVEQYEKWQEKVHTDDED